MSLLDRLIARIAREGPITVADYMTACLHDPQDGYYATRPRIGAAGDFITAPLVSQMFGEILGLWAAEVWERLGAPPRVRLAEWGPGDGTMISDVLRAAKAAPSFLDACEIWLVETSAPLRERQAAMLAGADVRWASSLAELPIDAPIILIANELLDCLPISQAVFVDGRWVERRVGLGDGGDLVFAPPHTGGEAYLVHEHSLALAEAARAVAGLIGEADGCALFIDYGRDTSGYGDTLQALRGHEKESPLAHPGAADLTAHVDFPAFAAAAAGVKVGATAIVAQGEFLIRLGIETRAAALTRARPDQADVIARQLARLIAPAHMGALFKAMGLHSPGLALPGFEAP